MTDRGASFLETLVAVTVLGVGAITVFGALTTLSAAAATADQRARSTVALLAARGAVTTACTPSDLAAVSVTVAVTVTAIDSCPRPGPRRVLVEAGVGQGHRHLTMIVDGGP